MANCNIVGQWAKAEKFYELAEKNLICWGGLTAGDWQYIGSQGVIQGTYEIFMRIAARHFGGDLRRPLRAHRRARRHGRRAAARRHAWRKPRSSASRSTRTRIDKRMAIGFLDTKARLARRRALR